MWAKSYWLATDRLHVPLSKYITYSQMVRNLPKAVKSPVPAIMKALTFAPTAKKDFSVLRDRERPVRAYIDITNIYNTYIEYIDVQDVG